MTLSMPSRMRFDGAGGGGGAPVCGRNAAKALEKVSMCGWSRRTSGGMSSQSFSDLTASASPTNFKVPPLLMKTCGYWPRRFDRLNISERRALFAASTPSISSTSIFLPRKMFRRLAWAPSTMVVLGMLVTSSSTASAVAASSDIVTAVRREDAQQCNTVKQRFWLKLRRENSQRGASDRNYSDEPVCAAVMHSG